MHLGKAIRMERIMNRNNGRTIVVPLDHGVTVGPIYGIVDPARDRPTRWPRAGPTPCSCTRASPAVPTARAARTSA